MKKPAYGYTIFCDDIRQETGGKFSFMGTYGNVMHVHTEFPAVLPKFGMAINYCQPSKCPTGPLTVRVFFPGDPEDKPSFETTIPLEKIQTVEVPADVEAKAFHVALLIPFAPLTLREAGKIRVQASCGGETIKLGTLRVEAAPPESPPTD